MTATTQRPQHPTSQVGKIIERWLAWAAAAKDRAAVLVSHGEQFDAELKLARGQIRAKAAELLRDTADPEQAAELMMRNAVAASVREPPMIGFDEAAVSYTRARTWQACAWELNPDLPGVQDRWT